MHTIALESSRASQTSGQSSRASSSRDRRSRGVGPNRLQDFHSASSGHADIKQNKCRPVSLNQVPRFITVRRFDRGPRVLMQQGTLARDNPMVTDCCSPKGYRWIFSERSARGEAKRYRRKGLDSTSRRIVDFVKAQGIENRTVLEVGGGIGAIQLELLKAGAARATSIELTPTYEEVASGLVREAGFADRIDRKVMDFATASDQIDEADVVIMNRVICCYPDMPKLAGAAADRTRELLVMSFPRDTWWTQMGLNLGNSALRILRREFHVFIHPPKEIIATSESHGLHTVLNQTGSFWTMAALRRSAQAVA